MGDTAEDLAQFFHDVRNAQGFEDLAFCLFGRQQRVGRRQPMTYSQWQQVRDARARREVIGRAIEDAMLEERITRVVQWANGFEGTMQQHRFEIDGDPRSELSSFQARDLVRRYTPDPNQPAPPTSGPAIGMIRSAQWVSNFQIASEDRGNDLYMRAFEETRHQLRAARRREESRTTLELIQSRVYEAMETAAINYVGPVALSRGAMLSRAAVVAEGGTAVVAERGISSAVDDVANAAANRAERLAVQRALLDVLEGRANRVVLRINAEPPIQYPITLPEGVTKAELGDLLRRVWDDVPALQNLRTAGAASGEAMQRETLAALHAFENQMHMNVQFVPEGTVRELTRNPRNVASLQGNRLMIEEQLLQDSRALWEEAKHEISSHLFGVRGSRVFPEIAGLPPGANPPRIVEWMVENGHEDVLASLFGSP